MAEMKGSPGRKASLRKPADGGACCTRGNCKRVPGLGTWRGDVAPQVVKVQSKKAFYSKEWVCLYPESYREVHLSRRLDGKGWEWLEAEVNVMNYLMNYQSLD